VGGRDQNPPQNNKNPVHQVGIPCYSNTAKVCLRKTIPHGSNICYFFSVKAYLEHAKNTVAAYSKTSGCFY